MKIFSCLFHTHILQYNHMDGMRRFAVCISSWLMVLETGPAGREIAYDKSLQWFRCSNAGNRRTVTSSR